MRLLSDGLENFDVLREFDYIYVDKTKFLFELVRTNKFYFLSRPRRFGKSLLVSTFESIFEGRQELFKGLFIDKSGYDFKPHPVIHLSLNEISLNDVDTISDELCNLLNLIANKYEIELARNIRTNPVACFRELIIKLNNKYNPRRVVILIDEYDAPILAYLSNFEKADAIRELFTSFYSVLKPRSGNLRFVFITGVTRFSKTSIFSGANHLIDITLDKQFSNICGFTVDEFDFYFQKYMEASIDGFKKNRILKKNATVSSLRKKILDFYDGYSWDGETRVLNPWSILNCLRTKSISNYWFESGNPSFLVNSIKNQKFGFDCFRNDNAINSGNNVVDVGQFDPITLMFQTGYLTIKTRRKFSPDKYFLKFPNFEVKSSLIPLLLFDKIIPITILATKQTKAMIRSLSKFDAIGFSKAFKSFLSSIPPCLNLKYEVYYQRVFILSMIISNEDVDASGDGGDGKFNVHIKVASGDIFIIELKYLHERDLPKDITNDDASQKDLMDEHMNKFAKVALDQIEENKYLKKFRAYGRKIYKTALVISYRLDILIVFEEAKNWKLVKKFDGSYVVADP